MLPEPLEWVFHLAKLYTSEEAPRLGLAMILNLTSTLQMAEARRRFRVLPCLALSPFLLSAYLYLNVLFRLAIDVVSVFGFGSCEF
jgi:hypothetical protein